MNKKGFSLTEILVVIAIIAIITGISIPSITNARKRVNERLFENKKEQILSYAELYGKDHPDVFTDGTEGQIKLERLLIDKYLEPDLKNGEGECIGYTNGCVINPVNNEILNNVDIVIKTKGASHIAVWNGNTAISNDYDLIELIKNTLSCTNITESNPCLYPANSTNNYIYDNGIMWRILGVYKLDGIEVVKLITDNTITWEE